ncbi:hypothetical protein NQZ68_012424 [Dissostichus eleginoides]|nr:hypothetical protein NQZ68_012424 [Dissostichus eleginoides]
MSVCSLDSRELRLSRAMVFAIEQINNSTELLPGIKLGYEIYDSCSSVPVAVHVAFQLSGGLDPVFNTGDKCSQSGMVMAVVGESGSTPSISMSRVIGPFNIPQVSHFATCACLSDKQQYPSFFRTIPSDQFQADALAKLVKHFGWTWIGAVRADSDYGNNGMASFLHAARKEGICVEYSESFYRTHPLSRIQRVADVIRRSTAKVVVAFISPGDMKILLEELSRKPSPPRQWIGSEAWVTDPDMLRFSFLAGAIGFGIEKSVIPSLRDFLLDLSPSKVADSPLLTMFWEEAFNCRLVLNQLKKVNFSQNGYDVSFDANGDPVAKYELVNWQKKESGSIELVTVGQYDSSLPVGQEFLINRNLTWVEGGTQVPVSVCTDSCPSGTRKVLQKGKPICCYDCTPCPEGEISNATDSFDCFPCPKEFWPNAERDMCLPKPVEFLSFNEALGIVLAAFSIGGACLAIITAAVFYRHRSSPIVRANNSELSFLLLFSLTLCFLCSLTFIGAPSEWSCMLRHTAFGITFVLCMSCVLGKTIVVLTAFKATLPELADSEPLALQSGGDVVIGGLFPLHFVAPKQQNSYHSKPQLTPSTNRQPAFSMDGDYVIGGVFSIHSNMHTVKHNYTTMPEPLSCAGSINSRGLRFSRAMVFAIEQINNSTELLPGIKLGYEIYDSCASVSVAVHVAFQLSGGLDPVFNTGDKCSESGMVMAVVGASASTSSISMSRIIGPFNIPQVSHFATCACLSDKQQYPSFFRTIPSDQFQADALAKLVKHFGWTWIGAVRSDSDYGNNGMESFLHAARKEGICVEYSESFYRTHPRSRIQRVADVIRRSTAKVVLAFTSIGDMRILLEELSRKPSPPRQWIGSESWVTDRDMLRFSFLAGAIGFGIEKSVIPGLRDFLLDLSPSKVADSPLLTMFWEEAFNCRLVKSEATDRSVCDGTEDIKTLQSSYTDTSQLRVTNMAYKAVYAIAHAIHNAVCEKTDSTTQCDKFTKLEAKEVLNQLKKVNFSQNGYDVSFDANGDPVAKYELVNWQRNESGSIELVTVGQYDSSLPVGQEFLINRNLTWVEGVTQVPVSVCTDSCPSGTRKVLQKGKPICCYDCTPCPEGEISNATDSFDCFPCPKEFWPNAERDMCLPKPVEFLSFNEALGIVLAAFSIGGACLSIITAAVFYRHRSSPIVRANNSELSFLLLFSLTLCFLCSLTFIGAPSEWSCMLRHTAFGITFVLCMSCVLGKTIVVLTAFKATLPGTTRQPAFSMDGDYVIGGVFSIHSNMHTVKHNYTTMPEPLSCAGSIDSRELRFSRAMVFAIEQINNSTELLPGIKLGYEIYDSCASVPVSVHVAFQLSGGLDPVFNTGDKCSQSGMVMAVVGESGSTPSISMSRVIGPFNIPQVSHFATCACLSDKQQYPSFFRTIPSDQFQADALAKLVKHFGWTWIGAVRADSDYGNNGMASFLHAARKEGICVEYSESFYRTHPLSRIQRVADVIRRSTAKVVVAFISPGDMKILLEELSRKPSPPRQWIGSEAWVTDPDMLRFSFLAGAIGFGIEKSVIPGLRDFLLDLSPSKVADSPLLTMFWEEAFNCRLVKSEATDRSVCDGTEDIKTLQSSYSDTSQLRITNMVYKAVYAIAHAIHNAVCQKTDSTTQCDKFTKLEAKEVLNQLKKVNFSQNGYDVSFDANGDPVAKYELVNWQKKESGSIELVTVGQYFSSLPVGQEFLINRNLTWVEGGTQEFWPNAERDMCLPKPVEFLSFNEALGIVLAAFSIGGACLTIITAAVFYRHRSSPIVRANNSELSFLLLFSLTLCFLCSLTFIGAPSEWSCMLRHTAFGITFVLCIPPFPMKNLTTYKERIILECALGSALGFWAGNNKLEPAADASANANLADDADINDQHVVLNAIASLKQDLVAKIEEKAIAQSAELQIQTTQIWTELRSVVEQVNKRIEVTEGRVSELEAEVSNHSDSITCMTSDVTGVVLFNNTRDFNCHNYVSLYW